jgi:hypothetical protein
MKNDVLFECGKCHKEKPKREMRRINNILICKDCYKEGKKEHREFLKRQVLGIRKRKDLLEEWKQKRKEREMYQFPKINNSNKKRLGKGSAYIFCYLTKVEKQFLYKKYTSEGLDPERVKEKIEANIIHLSDLVRKLMKQNKLKEEINRKFKEEFAKLIQS